MRVFVLAAVTCLVACTGHTPAPSTGTPVVERVRMGGTQTGLRLSSTTVARADTVWTPIDRVWKAMPAVFAVLEVPIERFDAESNTIGNSALKLYRRLGKTPLTRYLDCGTTQIGPNADSYEVSLTVLTKLSRPPADTANTTVVTTVEAMARPIQFRGDFVRCSSKGALEARVIEILKVELAP
ncbi:MAG: hypothetical protein ACRENU_02315 [Gemmatimonadaceae bacterium]